MNGRNNEIQKNKGSYRNETEKTKRVSNYITQMKNDEGYGKETEEKDSKMHETNDKE